MNVRRSRVAACALAAALTFGAAAGTVALAGPAAAGEPAAVSQTGRTVIAGAQARLAAGGAHEVSWDAAAGVRRVAVLASADPRVPLLTSRQVALTEGESVTVTGLDPARRWYFRLVPDGNPARSVVVAVRGLGVAAPNARDLGGYRTQQGFTVRWGQVFRSDALIRLTDADLQRLASMGIDTVADFRTDFEVGLNGPDRVPAGAGLVRVPVSDGGMYVKITDVIATRDPVLQEQALGGAAGLRLLIDANRSFVNDPAQRARFSQVLKAIAAGETTLYNCSAGKDRTGWMSAIILTALGVDRATVYQDYLLSNTYLAQANARTKAGIKAAGLMQNPDLLDPLLGVRTEYLDAAFDEVAKVFGSFENFLRDGLGIDGRTLAELRLRLLTP